MHTHVYLQCIRTYVHCTCTGTCIKYVCSINIYIYIHLLSTQKASLSGPSAEVSTPVYPHPQSHPYPQPQAQVYRRAVTDDPPLRPGNWTQLESPANGQGREKKKDGTNVHVRIYTYRYLFFCLET